MKKAVSLADIAEKAGDKIEAMRKQNREKSVARIKELTLQHQQKNGPKVDVKKSAPAKPAKEDSESDLSDVEPAKTEKGKFTNKNTQSKFKQENKRKQKEALKKNKAKRGKGAN